MAAMRKLYWDSSIFISLLSDTDPLEKVRAAIAEDILKHARRNEVEIWTSVWTIAEVLRPRSPIPASFPMPVWANLLEAKKPDGALIYPKAVGHFRTVWEYHERRTQPLLLLPPEQANKIRLMFEWPWLKKIDVVPAIAHKAAEIVRAHDMKAGDSIHVASALARHCDVIHRWDRDFKKTDTLIPSEEPQRMSPQGLLEIS